MRALCGDFCFPASGNAFTHSQGLQGTCTCMHVHVPIVITLNCYHPWLNFVPRLEVHVEWESLDIRTSQNLVILHHYNIKIVRWEASGNN